MRLPNGVCANPCPCRHNPHIHRFQSKGPGHQNERANGHAVRKQHDPQGRNKLVVYGRRVREEPERGVV